MATVVKAGTQISRLKLVLSPFSYSSGSQPLHRNRVEGRLKYGLLGPTPRVSDSRGLGAGQKVCISNKFPGNADAAGPGTTLLEPLHYIISNSFNQIPMEIAGLPTLNWSFFLPIQSPRSK